MSYSKETSLILDSTRGNEHLSSNQPLYYSSTYHQETLGAMKNLTMHAVVTLIESYLKKS